jgi:deoxycytidine triphosphate deaminase
MFFSQQTIIEHIQSGKIIIEPFNQKFLWLLSYEMHLWETITQVLPSNDCTFNGLTPKDKKMISVIIPDEWYSIKPNQFIIAQTLEKIICNARIMWIFDGKASLAQIGLFTNISSTLIEPETNSYVTCEIFNCSWYPITLYKNQKIGQVFFSSIS